MSTVVFCDTETLGLEWDAPIWEFAALRIQYWDRSTTVERGESFFIKHDPGRYLHTLPQSFRIDYATRYEHGQAIDKDSARDRISKLFEADANGKRPYLVGAVPSFDSTRLIHQGLAPAPPNELWHYHVQDIEALVEGVLLERRRGLDERPPGSWKSDDLSREIGVDPEQFDRHTAWGDVRWAQAQFEKIYFG